MNRVSVEAAEHVFAVLALVAGAGAVLLVVLRLLPGAGPTRILATVSPGALWLACLVAATAMGGSLYFSEYADFTPCKLCWYQRIAMYSSAIVLLVAAIRRDRGVRWYVVPLAGLGAIVSTYHYLVEWHPDWEATSCNPFAPCSVPWFRSFGFVSLSLMALMGFAAIITLLLIPAPARSGAIDHPEHADVPVNDRPS
jgi:disulfide bond formation protein DsbB